MFSEVTDTTQCSGVKRRSKREFITDREINYKASDRQEMTRNLQMMQATGIHNKQLKTAIITSNDDLLSICCCCCYTTTTITTTTTTTTTVFQKKK